MQFIELSNSFWSLFKLRKISFLLIHLILFHYEESFGSGYNISMKYYHPYSRWVSYKCYYHYYYMYFVVVVVLFFFKIKCSYFVSK